MPLVPSRHNVTIDMGSDKVVYNLSTGSCVPFPLIASPDSLSGKVKQALIGGGFLVDSRVDEKDLVVAYWESSRYDTSSCDLTIAPTLACNFSCRYCYAPRRGLTMDRRTADSVVRFIERLGKGTRELHVNWLGGEPLLALDTVLRIEGELRARLAIPISSKIITNGSLLSPSTIRKLAEGGISKVIVSIDGPPDVQRARRIWREGDSFTQVLRNVELAADTLRVILRINVDDSNLEHLPELARTLQERSLLPKVRLSVCPTQVLTQRCQHVAPDCLVTGQQLRRLIATCEGAGLTDWGIPPVHQTVCNGVRVRDFGIGPNGELYKCPVEIGSEEAVVGRVDGGPVLPNLLKWHRYRPTLQDDCGTCSCLPLCIGTCPLQLMQCSPAGSLQCEPVRHSYQDLVRLRLGEMLR